MTDKSDSIGKIAYEAAAYTTRCFQSWGEANQPKWEAAASLAGVMFSLYIVFILAAV